VLVAAVLRPEQREDRELEVVRLASQQCDDPGQLCVRQTERPVQRKLVRGDGVILQRLFGDPGQRASLAAASDGTHRRKRTPTGRVGEEE